MLESGPRISATIDGQTIDTISGTTILEAARQVGAHIPTLCFHAGFPAEGGCRVCLIELHDGEFAAACHTPLLPGMKITTDSDRLRITRRGLLELMVAEHDLGCFSPSASGDEFERLLVALDVGITRSAPIIPQVRVDDSNPYLRFRVDRCIVCRRCMHACERVQGQFVYGVAGRGSATHLIFGEHNRFTETDCTACGACVDVCPTGALTDVDRWPADEVERTVRTTCGYCGVGCQVDVGVSGGKVRLIQGTGGAAVNRGHLCAKGRYAHGYQRSPDRLMRPLVRRNSDFEEVSWQSAIGLIAEKIGSITKSHGADSVGALASSRSTNEAAYLLQKLTRAVLGTDNIDCCARVCHSSTALALQRVTGTGAATASYADIELARCIFVAGANPTEAHPVVGARIKQAVLAGATLIVADPRSIELASYATVHLQLCAGTNVALFNAIAKLLIESSSYDSDYLDERLEGFDALHGFLATQSVGALIESTGVADAQVAAVADLLKMAGPTLFVHGLGLSELTQGTDSVMALCNLAMLTGSIGRPGAGMLPLRGQNNVQGAADMGAAPRLVTGYQRLDDEHVRSHVSRVWGAPLPVNTGLTTLEMLEAAIEGRVRALWLQGEDVAHSDPYESRTLRALQNLDLLIVQDPFFNESARYADVILPATTTLENDGTYTNGERRIQRVRPAAAAPGEVRQDWVITRDIANALGAKWDYESPADVMDEIAKTAPALFGGISYDRLNGDGIQWPCPNRAHAGTEIVHENGFLRGKGLLTCVAYRPSPESQTPEYPFRLITGRLLQQYNVGTMTRRTANVNLMSHDILEINADDADRLLIKDGGNVRVVSRWGETEIMARVTSRVTPGTLFASFHFPESHVNRLVGPYVDPDSKCPEYKLIAVRIEHIG